MNQIDRVSFYKAKCVACFKSSEVPTVDKPLQSKRYYFVPRSFEVRFATFSKESALDGILCMILDNDKKLQMKNDDSKGQVAWSLIGCLADFGPWILIDGNNRCPHCGSRLLYKSSTLVTSVIATELTFTHLETLDQYSIEQRIQACRD
jgi:DNA-directed RNA polymerase subunit RPC12/RpoP